MDSLRYLVIECHVDGFRFDLASALAREFFDVDRLSAFFDVIHQDPVLSQVKLIAEPWDVGPGRLPGRQLPGAVVGVERRSTATSMRDFWRGRGQRRGVRVALHRLERPLPGRRPRPVRLDQLHHRARRLHAARPRLLRRTSTTRPTARTTATAPTTTARGTAASRARPTTPRCSRCARASSATCSTTLLLSQGVPMILGGDEFGRTQQGNNNAWCQDNELSWFDWEHEDWQRELARVHAAADRAAPRPPGLPPRSFLRGDGRGGRPARRLVVSPRRAADDPARLARAGRATCSAPSSTAPSCARRRRDGEPKYDDSFLVLLQRPLRGRRVRLPSRRSGARWTLELSTADPGGAAGLAQLPPRADALGAPAASRCTRAGARTASPSRAREPGCARPTDSSSARASDSARRGARAVRAAPRREPPLSLAIAPGAKRLDARLRRRRSTRVSDALGGEAALRELAGARARADPRHRAQPYGRRHGEPLLERPRAA